MKKDVEQILDEYEISDSLEIIAVVDAWSNGKTIRRYQGQGEHSNKSPDDGFRKMVAILVEVREP